MSVFHDTVAFNHVSYAAASHLLSAYFQHVLSHDMFHDCSSRQTPCQQYLFYLSLLVVQPDVEA